MSTLKLYGMRSAYDEIMASGIKRQHEPPRIVGDLLQSEIAEKQARSIKYQITVAKLPLAKDISDFDFTDRRSTRDWCASSRAELSLPSSTISFSLEELALENPFVHRTCPCLDPQRRARALLQRRRSRQSS